MSQDTPFRAAERRWKLKKPNPDWDEAIDQSNVYKCKASKRETFRLGDLVLDLDSGLREGQVVETEVEGWTFEGFPGLIYLPSLLPISTQRLLTNLSFSLTTSSHTTSLSAQHYLPLDGLFNPSLPSTSYLEPIPGAKGQVERVKGPRVRVDRAPATVEKAVGDVLEIGKTERAHWISEDGVDEETAKPMLISDARLKIRWSLLGHAYDWNTKSYPPNDTPLPFPREIAILSRRIVNGIFPKHAYKPDTGIVNYYGLSHSLTAHVDQSEPSGTSHPLLSISLGSSCIFLFGAETREKAPLSLRLRSGDVVIMHGQGRKAFHGVPRIIPNSAPDWIELEEEITRNWMKDGGRINVNVRQMM